MVEKSDFVFNDWEEGVSSVIERISLGTQYIFETDFSKLVNPNYVSLYILLVLSFYLKKKLKSRIQLLVLTILFLYLFLMASPAAYLILFIMSLILVFNIKDRSQKYIVCMLLILGTVVFLKNPRIADFYASAEELENNSGIHRVTVEKSRLLTWNASIQLIKEAPIFGYGIGDANDVLIEKYKELDYFSNYQNKYNAHNQFLQTWLQTGIFGFGILISVFILLALRMKRSRNEFSVFLILFISLLFESMLVRFNGIVFFSIIVPLLLKKRSILSSRIIRNHPTTIDS
nr:O-antigen ligase family protein [Aquimarina sp. MMG016]